MLTIENRPASFGTVLTDKPPSFAVTRVDLTDGGPRLVGKGKRKTMNDQSITIGEDEVQVELDPTDELLSLNSPRIKMTLDLSHCVLIGRQGSPFLADLLEVGEGEVATLMLWKNTILPPG